MVEVVVVDFFRATKCVGMKQRVLVGTKYNMAASACIFL